MCVVVYIAADRPLPLVPWDEHSPAFHATELTEAEADVRRHFGKPHVYYAGSHEGCGCGFQYGAYPGLEDEDEMRAAAESRGRLAAYLERALERSDTVELYTCWDGEWSHPPAHRSELRPGDLLTGRTHFLDREFINVHGRPRVGHSPEAPKGRQHHRTGW